MESSIPDDRNFYECVLRLMQEVKFDTRRKEAEKYGFRKFNP
jgi:hypothetical protein